MFNVNSDLLLGQDIFSLQMYFATSINTDIKSYNKSPVFTLSGIMPPRYRLYIGVTCEHYCILRLLTDVMVDVNLYLLSVQAFI